MENGPSTVKRFCRHCLQNCVVNMAEGGIEVPEVAGEIGAHGDIPWNEDTCEPDEVMDDALEAEEEE